MPAEISELRNLTSLDLSYNRLTALPAEISELRNLTSLDLGGNRLTAVPAEISELRNLTSLDLSGNRLTALPAEISELRNLTSLALSRNQLTAWPAEISELRNLTSLDLSGNELTALPAEISELRNLTSLDLRYNKLTPLPAEISELRNLTSLDLGYNQLTALPAEIAELRNLTSLDLSGNELTALPAEISELRKLTSLDLWGNQLTALPAEITELRNLTSLDLSGNRLTALPAEITRLTNLTSLDLRYNQLTALPAEISELRNLTSLALRGNQLTALLAGIRRLGKLTSLDLSANQLTALPAEITQLTNLQTLDLRKNEQLKIPPEILKNYKDAPSILRYIEQLAGEEEKRPLNEAKMLLVGEGGVGKTSLVNMLIEGKADPHEPTTEGIDIRRWPLAIGKGDPVHLNIWDFGGQEIYHATHQFFLTKRSLYLLVLNAREGETRGRLDYWLKIIASFGGDSPVIVVTNWSDEQRLELNRRDLQQKYPNRIRAFVDTSCLRDLKGEAGQNGIDELKSRIAAAVSTLEHIRDPLLARWFEVKKQLEEIKENYIPESQYIQMCEAAGIDDKRDQDLLLGYLNDLGVVLTFRDDRRLKDTNILQPEWVTHGIYRILNSHQLFESKGVLEVGVLNQILDAQDYPSDKHDFLIAMMKKFELCFPFEGREDRYLIPDLLPKQEPVLYWDEAGALAWEYHYDVLPGNVISRFIVRTSHLLPRDRLAYWRSGVVLDIDGSKARVKADSAAGRITVSILGREPARHRALAVIRDHFASIHDTIPGVTVEEKVPLRGQGSKPVDYQYLLKLREKGIEKFLPEGGEEEVSVAWLLEGIEERRVPRDSGFDEPRPGRRFRPAAAPREAPQVAPAPVAKSPWSAGSFYLVTFVVVFLVLVVGSYFVPWPVLSGITAASVFIVFFIYAAQLRNDEKLKDETYGQLMLAGLKRLRNPFGGAPEGD